MTLVVGHCIWPDVTQNNNHLPYILFVFFVVMWLFTLVHTLFSFSYNPILYYNAACGHRRGSVHRLSDSSVGWSVCHDRGTQLGTRNRVLDGRSRSPCKWAILREKGRPIGRRTYDCTVPGWHCTIISPPSNGSIGLRQPLSELFIPEKFSLRLVSRFFLLGTPHKA